MTPFLPGSGALPVRRSRLVDTDQLTAVVVEVDPTQDPRALAVLQAGLHEPPDGQRLIYGYRVHAAGLGAWVKDRRLRVTIWPALVDAAGEVFTADLDDPDADLLVIDFDAEKDRVALDQLVRIGRLIVAGPDAGPVPLVVDLDRDLVAQTLGNIDG